VYALSEGGRIDFLRSVAGQGFAAESWGIEHALLRRLRATVPGRPAAMPPLRGPKAADLPAPGFGRAIHIDDVEITRFFAGNQNRPI